MSRLQHRTAPSFTYFITTKTWQNREIFRVLENADILVQCLLKYRESGAYLLHEFVIMPDHLHLLLTPNRATSLEKAMQLIKGGSSHAIHERRGNKMQIWQPGFHEESIRNLNDLNQKANYIRTNPVHAHLVATPQEWLFGSAKGEFATDAAPERLAAASSGAKAPQAAVAGMSELKLRPPKIQVRGSRPC